MSLQPVGGRGVALHPVVQEVAAGRRLRWRGRLGFRGLLDGDHVFTLVDRPDGAVRLVQAELVTGLLVPLLARSLATHTRPGFEAMNEALKNRVERAPAARAG